MINEFEKYKPKHQTPKIEDITLKEEYAFTFNPLQTVTGNSTAFRKNRNILSEVTGMFRTLSSCLISAKVCIYTELSSTMKLHAHGTIYINNLEDWVTECSLLMGAGTICIKELFTKSNPIVHEFKEFRHEWHDYCSKQFFFWKPIFKDTIYAYPYVVPLPNTIGAPTPGYANLLNDEQD